MKSRESRVKFTVDGKNQNAAAGANLLEVLKQNGINVPSLCWDPGIEPSLGTCRVCIVRKNGRDVTGCTQVIEAGDEILVHTPELANLRKGVTELLFSEGNHFCPGCEKSGDCSLQKAGYDQGITHSRFPYKFTHFELDYRGKHLLLERNRCIHCKRCTDLFVDDHGRKVFRFTGKGHKTCVEMDLNLEADMSLHKKREAVELCPTGAIIMKGRGFDRPIGSRKLDKLRNGKT
jgi:NADH dehydrogenase/NADH:ubiquinone oxidoreductase subunit G